MSAPRLVTSLLAIGLAVALAGCGNSGDRTLQGWVEADQIFVSPDESGRVETLSVSEGAAVDKGAPLFTLDDELQRADFAMAEASLTNAQHAFDRAQALLKTAAGTQKAVDETESALRTAEARLVTAKTRLKRREVASPVGGIVQRIYYRPGEQVPAGRPVVALLPPGNIKVRFFASEAMLPRIGHGQAVKIRCSGCPDELTARVSFIARSAEFTPPVIYSQEERSKLVYLIEARPDAPAVLRVGQPVDVQLVEP